MIGVIILLIVFLVAAHFVGNKWGTITAADVRSIGYIILSCSFFHYNHTITDFFGWIGILLTAAYLLYVMLKKPTAPVPPKT